MSEIEWKKIKDAKKFPESFKPLVYAVGKKAVELGLVGDALYDALPFLIRYNRFTMKVSPHKAKFAALLNSYRLSEIYTRQVEGLPSGTLPEDQAGALVCVKSGNCQYCGPASDRL